MADPNLTAYVAPALVVGARVSGWMSFTPFFNHAALPVSVKAGLTLALTALLFPVVSTASVGQNMPGPAVLAGEMAVGMVMGLCLQLVFEGIQLGGQIISTQLGFSLANMIDPMSQVETTVITVFHQSIGLLIFLQMDIHHRLLQALGRSFTYIPAGTAFTAIPKGPQLMAAASGMFLIGIEIAAPVMLATMVTDVTLAFLSRTSPQLPVMLIGVSIKSMLGFGVIAATVQLWPWMFEKHFLSALSMAERLLTHGR